MTAPLIEDGFVAPRRLARIWISPEIICALIGLPDDIRGRSLAHDPATDMFTLIVEGAHCPVIEHGSTIPLIAPKWRHNDDGSISLVGIDGYDGPVEESIIRVPPRRSGAETALDNRI
jgi:hypothetical protein